MKMSSRSFPHPVVGNADDVLAEYQATFDFSSDKTNFYLDVHVQTSSTTLKKQIRRGAACHTLHVECSNTLFRRTFDFTADKHREAIPATLLNGSVEVNAFVRATKAIPEYTVAEAHDDYADATFDIQPGDILALANTRVFDAEHSVDPLRKVGALMVVTQSPKPGEHPMEVDFNQDRIHILLCKGDYEAYQEVKAVPNLTSHLTTTLVLPVLMAAIEQVQASEEDQERWSSLLRQRLEVTEVKEASDTLTKAQLLLEYPIRRALQSAKAIVAGST